MKLKVVIISVFIILGLLTGAVSIYQNYSNTEELITSGTKNHLDSLVFSKKNHIEDYLREQEEKIKIAATRIALTTEELKEIEELEENFYEVFVLNQEGIIIASSDETKIGLNRRFDDYFIGGREEIYIKDAYFSEDTQREAIAISTPFNKGVLVARINMNDLNDILTSRTDFAQTEESYLVNDESYMITPSRFLNDTFLKQKINSKGTDYCFDPSNDGNRKIMDTYSDYRNKEVIGTYAKIDRVGWCLLVEIDKEEISEQIRESIVERGLLRLIISLIFFIILGYLLAHLISNPIKRLTEDVEKVTKGELDIKFDKSNIEEQQNLINSLNRILASMKLAILRTNLSKEDLALTREGAIIEKKKATKELEKMVDLLDKSSLTAITDKKGNITYANDLFVKVSKYKEEELIGQNHRIIKSGFHSPQFYKSLWDTILKGNVWHGIVRNKAKDGEIYWVRAVISPTYDDHKQIDSFMAIRTPITDMMKDYEEIIQKEIKGEKIDPKMKKIIDELRTGKYKKFNWAPHYGEAKSKSPSGNKKKKPAKKKINKKSK